MTTLKYISVVLIVVSFQIHGTDSLDAQIQDVLSKRG